MGRNIRTGNFDFFLAQPGNVMFMATTRKIDPDSLINSLVALSVVIYSAHQLGLHPGPGDIALYAVLVVCGIVIHYSILVLSIAPAFWITSAQGIEGSYFTLSEFSRLPRQAFSGLTKIVFVWILPMVVVSNVPASRLIGGTKPGASGSGVTAGALAGGIDSSWVIWVLAITVAWFLLAVFVFNRGLRRYSSASS
jgi:ABC-2 type transport system permease protein